MPYTVKQMAEMSGVSVRTLHHYDEIGLLSPAGRSAAGYRKYSEEDVEKLQQILFFKELGFELGEIAKITGSPDFDRRSALADHKMVLLKKMDRIKAIIKTIDKTMESLERGNKMNKKEMFGAFDEKTIEEYRKEARARYGEKAVECERRTAKYAKDDWRAIQDEYAVIYRVIGDMMLKGADPASAAVQEQIGRHYSIINEKFYSCTPEIFRGLGELYVSDARFTAFYENIEKGLAEYMRRAMAAYCDNIEKKKA